MDGHFPAISAALALLMCAVLTPVLRDLAIRLQWLDQPDFDRKVHKAPVPRIGGIPIVVAFTASFGIFILRSPSGSDVAGTVATLGWQLIPASLLIFATGVLDDLIGLKPKHKLVGQVAAATLACLSGLRFEILTDTSWGTAVAAAATVLWLVACSNAFNLIDGVDGLAAGLGLIGAFTAFLVALSAGNVGMTMLAACMAGALLAFLRYNINPASIFLGDSGSLWIGFLLASFGVIWSHSPTALPSVIVPAMALSIPLTDTALSIIRRFVSGRSIFEADHGHIHHRLLDRGLTPRHVAFVLWGAAALASGLAVLVGLASGLAGGLATAVFFCASTWLGIRKLRYLEFRVFAQLMRSVRSNVRIHLLLLTYETRLRAASSPEECWLLLRNASRDFGFTGITLRLAGSHFQDRAHVNGSGVWLMRLPLSPTDYVSLTREPGCPAASEAVARFADLLHGTLSEKAGAFRSSVTVDRRASGEPRTYAKTFRAAGS